MSKRIHKCSRQSLCPGWPLLVHADEGGESQDQVSAGQRDVRASCAPIGCSVGRCGQETRETLISCDCTFTWQHPPFENPQSAWYGASKWDCKNCNYSTTAAVLSWFHVRGTHTLQQCNYFIFWTVVEEVLTSCTEIKVPTPRCKNTALYKSTAFNIPLK